MATADGESSADRGVTRVLSRAEYDIARADFDQLDKDGNGLLEKPEVAALLKAQLGRELSSEELDAAFQSILELDSHADQQVTPASPITLLR